jgi:hypothetical protein
MIVLEFCKPLVETSLPDEASVQRRFSLPEVSNRRFMFSPRTKKFVIGSVDGGSGAGSHAAEYYAATGSNHAFDSHIRGWLGWGGSYRNGIIHFAPPIMPDDVLRLDQGMECLKLLATMGANGKTMVRGFPGAWEQKLDAIFPAT